MITQWRMYKLWYNDNLMRNDMYTLWYDNNSMKNVYPMIL